MAPPPRLEELGVTSEKYHEDNEVWRWRVLQYWRQISTLVEENSLRNVMDMRASLGGFAAALADKDVWVMNVVPANESNKLKIVYDRGLIGTVHDWCESFSTYPRTYDLLHAALLFSHTEQQGCSLEDLLLEMDRILRPFGFVIIRDQAPVVNYIRRYLAALKWDAWSFEFEPGVDALSRGEERILMARKGLWKEKSVSW
ncbi:hypothetical protein HPP92_016458 [Vanilla planifolia]|nr:hypothetical protein HPP92_016458 [Vanilla planifolia]